MISGRIILVFVSIIAPLRRWQSILQMNTWTKYNCSCVWRSTRSRTTVLSLPYLASSFTCIADMPHRSASTERLDVPTCRRSTVGGRAFPVAGACKGMERPTKRCDISFVAGVVQEQAQDVLVPLQLWKCLTLNDTFFSQSLHPSSTVVLAIVLTV